VSVLKVTLALAAAWVLGGCSALRLAYDNADIYFKFRAASYLDLYGRDAQELDEGIEAFFAWHRSEALPHYARLAEEAAQRVGKGLSREDLVWGYDSLVAHARHSLRAAAERIAPLLDRLTPEQVAYMEKGFAADNRRYARENLRGSEQERRERRAKRVQERLEDWVGNLSQAQVERIAQYSQRAPLYYELRDRDRKRLQADVLEMVRARQAQRRLAERLVHWERGYDPAHLEASRAAREALYDLLLDLDRSMTPGQRALAQETFGRYAQDFTLLARHKGQ
jgi:hypothetical protein